MPIDQNTQRAVEGAGWKIARKLAEGGGGEAYIVYRKVFLEGILRSGQLGTAIGVGPDDAINSIASHVDQIHSLLVKGVDLVAVLKVAKGDPARTKREIATMASCQHPNVVRLLDADPAEMPKWFVMQFQPKGDLSAHQATFHGDALAVLRKIRPVIDAVAVLHGAGLVHRDIKARNIFVNAAGDWVLGDFGIAYEQGGERFTGTEQTLFSKDWRPDWVAAHTPESFTPSVDIFGLAKVVYFMVSSRKVPASHIDEGQNDIRTLFPRSPGIQELHELLMTHVVSKERNVVSKTAAEFGARIDDLVRDLAQPKADATVFSFASTHSITHVGSGSDALENLLIKLPPASIGLELRLRVLGAQGQVNLGIGLKDSGGATFAQEDRTIVQTNANTGFGAWMMQPLTVRFDRRSPGGWHRLSLRLTTTNSLLVTGLVVQAV